MAASNPLSLKVAATNSHIFTGMNLELQHISKSFPGVKALDDVSIIFRGGKVHAICGENGAGKSTLLNIITGNLQPDEGNITIDDKSVSFSSPQQAYKNGIAIVYQHLSLVDPLSIAENIYASFPPVGRFGLLDRKKMLQQTNGLLKKLNLDYLKADQLVSTLSAGQKQMVEIAKALSSNPRIVFFDEPTASISQHDAAILFKIIDQLKKDGTAIVYISHRMTEIFSIADTVTVLKDGKTQGTFPINEVTTGKLVRGMIGRDIIQTNKKSSASSEEIFSVTDFSGPGFKNINFSLHKGEITGMAGLVGAGRTEIAKAIFGANKASKGKLKIKNRETEPFHHPAEAIQNGIAYITEDRRSDGLFLSKSVAENIFVTDIALQPAFHPAQLEQIASSYCESLHIKTNTIHKKTGELSGGNQQKVLLAKWLHIQTDVLILDEPTHGIDAGAKAEIYKIIQQLAEDGKAILLISSELPELLHLCHRILVIKEGKMAGSFTNEEATEEIILSAAM